MKYPKINTSPTRTVTVPKLSGGINLRDSVTLVADNQLTDAKNIWYKDGILKTRPAISTFEGMKYGIALKDETCCGKPTDIYMNKGNIVYRLFQFETSGTENGELQDGSTCEVNASHNGFFWVSSVGIIPLPEIDGGISFVTKFKDKIYVFTKNRNIYTMKIDPNESTPKWVEVKNEIAENLNKKTIYIPIVATNCKPIGGSADKEIEYDGNYGGVLLEGYNLLSSYYKMIYSTVNREVLDASDESSSHDMKYELIHSVANGNFNGLKVKVTIKNGENGTPYTHEVTLNGSAEEIREQSAIGGLIMGVRGCDIVFYTSDGNIKKVTKYDYFENNMEIIAPCPNSSENLDKIFGMCQSTWFGGDALGISGGTRLLLGGNTNSGEESLVLWSGLNDPTYFPENCYAYVGDSTQKVTAFGRQGDTLVIFKEREIYYTQYTRNSDITAESLISQSVVDYTASNVYFPMIQLHSAIGCDCPNTVQLCRNFLVWASSDGNVYTLRTQNQFSERNIYCVSDMIKRRFYDDNLKNAYSADYDGHYFLFTERNVYVMNYESYGYINVSSYNKTADAQSMIPWWVWDIPFEAEDVKYSANSADRLSIKGAFTIGDRLYCVFYNADGFFSSFCAGYFAEYQSFDEVVYGRKTPIKSSFTTKIFDFDSPHTFKKVPVINISFGNNYGAPIYLSFVTDNLTEHSDTVVISESEEGEHSAEFVHNRQFRPCVTLFNRIGVKVECEGKMSVNSISLDYKILGGAR